MPYTLGQAAKATGKSKPTIQAAIKKGRISATQDELGRYSIDPAELHRVYPPVSQPNRQESPEPNKTDPHLTAEKEAEIKALQARLEVMEQLVSELRADKAELRGDVKQWQGVAYDFQQRLKAIEGPKEQPQEASFVVAEGTKASPQRKSFNPLNPFTWFTLVA